MKSLIIIASLLLSLSATAQDYNSPLNDHYVQPTYVQQELKPEYIPSIKETPLYIAPDPYAWSGGQIIGEGLYVGLLAEDFHQSIHFVYPEQHEANPLMPKYPTPKEFRVACIGTLALQGLAAHFLPTYRNSIIGVSFSLEAFAVYNGKIQHDNLQIPQKQPQPQVISLHAKWTFN